MLFKTKNPTQNPSVCRIKNGLLLLLLFAVFAASCATDSGRELSTPSTQPTTTTTVAPVDDTTSTTQPVDRSTTASDDVTTEPTDTEPTNPDTDSTGDYPTTQPSKPDTPADTTTTNPQNTTTTQTPVTATTKAPTTTTQAPTTTTKAAVRTTQPPTTTIYEAETGDVKPTYYDANAPIIPTTPQSKKEANVDNYTLSDVLPDNLGDPPKKVRPYGWFGPTWRLTAPVQEYTDWCYAPLYEPTEGMSAQYVKKAGLVCGAMLHSFMPPTHPKVSVHPECLVAVYQHHLVNKLDYFDMRPRGTWPPAPTKPLPSHVGADPRPTWADCPSKLWPGSYLPPRTSPEAGRACAWGLALQQGIDPKQSWELVTERGAVATEQYSAGCIEELWHNKASAPYGRYYRRCEFAWRIYSSITHKERVQGREESYGIAC